VVKIAIGSVVVVVLVVGLLISAMLKQAAVSCEVCISFHGRTQCRSAAGPSETVATRTATDNACAYLAWGMADGISCSNTPPDSTTCDTR